MLALPADLEVSLASGAHTRYIQSLDTRRDSYDYWLTEHLRLNGVYWGLGALHLLGRPDALPRDETVAFVLSCWHGGAQDDDEGDDDAGFGGFGAAPGHDAHMLSTVSAVQVLVMVDALDELDRRGRGGHGGKLEVARCKCGCPRWLLDKSLGPSLFLSGCSLSLFSAPLSSPPPSL
jgi:geranylgeranyl transferase type-2 subunit beta